jgi:hypothetical protein
MLNKRWVASGLLVLLASACTLDGGRSEDPKRRLTEYISRSFVVKAPGDRASLMPYLTGESKRRLVAWSDEQFRQAFIDTKRVFVKLAMREVKTVSSTEISITYELTYLDQSKGHDAKVTNRKLAHMVLEQGRWMIGEVRNIKELVEYRDGMTISLTP